MPLLGREKVDAMIKKNKTEANTKVRAVYLGGLKPVIDATPADKGIHRNNWFLSVGVPFSLFGRTGNASGNASFRSLETMPDYVLNKKLFFTNNGPAISSLEYGGFPSPVKKGSYIKKSNSYEILSSNGFSIQAPKGWVRSTLIQMQNKIRSL